MDMHFSGAQPDLEDKRDHPFEPTAGAALIDWTKGYDVRSVFGLTMKTKNQFSSSSCVGQGAAYYAWVKQVKEMMRVKNMTFAQLQANFPELIQEVSAKAIYSLIALGENQGAYIRDGVKIIVDWGALFESDVSSYKADGTTDEKHMIDTAWKTIELATKAKMLKGADYKVVQDRTIESIAAAIQSGDGVLGGVFISGNGTWSTPNPQPPLDTENWSGHCIYFGAFGTDALGKFIATPNSWGDLFGPWDGTVGSGWQKLRENYCNNRHMFNPWTLIDQDNIELPMRVIPHLPYYERIENEPAICVYDKDTDSMFAFESGQIFLAVHGGYSNEVDITVVKKNDPNYKTFDGGFSRKITKIITTKPY